jgi:hypothetical protein
MRKLHLVALVLGVSASAGCKSKDAAPPGPESVATSTPASPSVGDSPAPTSTSTAPTAPPSFVVYTGAAGAIRTVGATIEDGSAPPVTLSSSGVDTTFAGVLPSGRRALLVEHKADKTIDSVVAVRGDGTARSSFGALPAGKYAALKQVRSEGEVVVVEASRAGSEAVTDVLALRAGAPVRVLAADSTLVAADAKRAAVMTAGNLRGITLDGATTTALGGGDGHDRVAEVKDARILLTVHTPTGDDVRTISLDGASPIAFGKPDADETAFAFGGGTRVVFVRKSGAGQASLVSAALTGKDEQVLTAPAADVSPVQVTAAGDVLYRQAAGMLAVSMNGGAAPRVLDPAVGTNIQIGAVQDGLVVYRSDSPNGPALRAVKLDGTGLKVLCEGVPNIPFFAGMTSSGRVVYYRALSGQQEGGRLFSIKTDGSDLRPIGTGVPGPDGKPMIVADQDFEARTPAGRLILESEFITNGGSQLVVASHDTDSAKLLAGASHVRFAALIP